MAGSTCTEMCFPSAVPRGGGVFVIASWWDAFFQEGRGRMNAPSNTRYRHLTVEKFSGDVGRKGFKSVPKIAWLPTIPTAERRIGP